MLAARGAALQPLDELTAACSPPSDELVQQVPLYCLLSGSVRSSVRG